MVIKVDTSFRYDGTVEPLISAHVKNATGRDHMKFLTAAICLVSVGILSGCVDDRGYRSQGYYATGVQYRSYDRDRHYRHDDRDYRRDRGRNWRNNERYRYPSNRGDTVEYGVIVR